jgi:hypothetical protein
MREARRPASREAAARAGQAGGLGAAIIRGAGVFLLHRVTIHAQKIHMLALIRWQLWTPGPTPSASLRFRISVSIRQPQPMQRRTSQAIFSCCFAYMTPDGIDLPVRGKWLYGLNSMRINHL